MKKIAALFMALLMLLGCTALAEVTPLADFGTENTLVYARTVAYEAGEVDVLGNPTNNNGCPCSSANSSASPSPLAMPDWRKPSSMAVYSSWLGTKLKCTSGLMERIMQSCSRCR